jgi:hypothetical protein
MEQSLYVKLQKVLGVTERLHLVQAESSLGGTAQQSLRPRLTFNSWPLARPEEGEKTPIALCTKRGDER